jgi:hypothetical protein
MSWYSNLFNRNRPISVERDSSGNWFTTMFSSNVSFKSVTTDKQKLDIILCNPAALKVFKLNCDLYSLGKIQQYKNEKLFLKDALKTYQKKPNKYQTWKQLHWDYCFYRMLGTAYLWRSNNTNLTLSSIDFYFLNPAKMEWSNEVLRKLDKLILSNTSFNELEKETVEYTFEDGTKRNIPLKEITPFFDLSNSVSGNWYKGNSAIDALYKILGNVEEGLDAKNINLRYSGKFGITGQQDPNNVYQTPMGDTEKESIESKVDGSKKVFAFKSQVNIQRFVSDIANLKLDESYLSDYFIIGSMYGIPRDVLESTLKGSTYENQEKATGKHISYSLQPMADDFVDFLGDFLSLELKMEWNYLPFMQVFENERAKTSKFKAETIKILIEAGFSKDEAVIMANN